MNAMQSRILKRLGLVLPVILLALAACSFRQQEAPSTTDLPEFQRVTVLQDTSIELLPGEHQNMELGSSAVSPDDPDAVPGIREARFEWFWEQRAYPLKTVPFMANNRALQQARSMHPPEPSLAEHGPGPASGGMAEPGSEHRRGCTYYRQRTVDSHRLRLEQSQYHVRG